MKVDLSASATAQRALQNRLSAAAGIFGLAMVLGTAGYYFIGGGQWTVGQCFYMTVVTLSTVGFAETLPNMDSVTGSRSWTIVLILLGSGTLLYFVSTLTAFIVEGDLGGALRRQRMSRLLEKIHDHVIVCGAGSTGQHVIYEMLATHTPFVVVDHEQSRIDRLTHESGRTFLYVLGDATEDGVLEEAGIQRASGLVAALREDRDNLFLTVTARALNERMRLVSKVVEPENLDKLRRAGADSVVSPAFIGGMRLASEMIRPVVVGFLDKMLREDDADRRIEELVVPDDSRLRDRTLGQSNLRTHSDALVIAIRDLAGEVHYNPSADTRIEGGSVLILLVKTADIPKLRNLFAPL